MAYNDDQSEYPLPANDGKANRKTAELLPRYFRTEKNKKFLEATLDQVLQPGVAEKISGYYGRSTAKAFSASDNYIGDISENRLNYQLEPATVYKDQIGNVLFYKDYNDYLNQINVFGGTIDNASTLNSQESYAWNPNIDWDKFVNFREYYWLPTGPLSIAISGQSNQVISTYTVTTVDNGDNVAYLFSPDGVTQNPSIVLYRGQTYKFEINAPGMPLTFRTSRELTTDNIYTSGITNQSIATGVIEFTVPLSAPDTLYYLSDTDINTSGLVQISDIADNSSINIELDILGKKSYVSSNGVELLNGMKVKFKGLVTPEKYKDGEWYIDGVGDKITLIAEKDLEIAGAYSDNIPVLFDTEKFDTLPFGNANSYSVVKDYVVINRSAIDKNAWSRNNKWFHKTVIEKSAELNNQPIDVDQAQRAKRPIIEFDAGLKLYNFGTSAKLLDVDLIDDKTADVFSTIEGSLGYNIDGTNITEGMRILFTADTDIRVKNRIYKVKFIKHQSNNLQIALVEELDTLPVENEVALITNGVENAGKHYYFNGTEWKLGQLKESVNQSPLFDLVGADGISFSDYEYSTFAGTKVFGYKTGTGTNDVELGFPIVYRALENIGDIVFEFNLINDSFTYIVDNVASIKNTDIGFLRKYSSISNFEYKNGWIATEALSTQKVIRQYITSTPTTDFAIDVYDNSAALTDLSVSVTVDSIWRQDYELVNINDQKYIRFDSLVVGGSSVIIKSESSSVKNKNGYYEFPSNLEKNPLNDNLSEFTLGEVSDHVFSIVESSNNFSGQFPGPSNLGNLGDISNKGRKIVQHSGPMNLALYHITDRSANIVKSIDYAKKEYRKFKRVFLQVAETLGYDGPVKQHVDLIIKEVLKDKTKSDPFYFSDMIPFGGTKRLEFVVYDVENVYFSLSKAFNLTTLTQYAVLIYKNGEQLLYDRDYVFNADGFAIITAEKQVDDIIEIYEYTSTDGNYIPPTPTKLGLFPKFEPQILTDNTYITPRTIIQGHDGSRIIAFQDYRDQLILELETRIFNNIKSTYDSTKLNIHDFISGEFRDTGFSKSQIDKAMINDFIQWTDSIGSIDYTSNIAYDPTNSFTFNYSSMNSPSDKKLPGGWRAIYKQAYDTDRPHTHPWEMLGFSIKPTWWETSYGPAPYTSDNLVLWEDLSQGIIRKPNEQLVYNNTYARPTLLNHLPVDSNGNLLSPNDSRYSKGFVVTDTRNSFVFGDEASVETAWRRSSEYAFSLLKAWILNQPNKVFGLGFDTSRIKKNLAGQYVYTETDKAIRLSDLVFPNTPKDSVRVLTSGLVNYVYGYLLADSTGNVSNYKKTVTSLTNQLGIKLGAFSDVEKLRFILDSRTPFNKGNVFLPKENYQLFLNKSSPIDVISYSGVIVEKTSAGYVLKGYDKTNPVFKYNRPIVSKNDNVINVGGISEAYSDWEPRKQYIEGKNVKYQNTFYRIKIKHTSGNNFEINNFTKLAELPITGGAIAYSRKSFYNEVSILPYGTLLTSKQDVVDFLFGYSKYLEETGFKFDYYNNDTQIVENWKLSIKEFLYFTTQNWAAGTVITLSPSASQIKFSQSYAAIDDLYDSFYQYSILQANGQKLNEEFTRLVREDGAFSLNLANTADGIYHIKLPLVQFEHVALLDNISSFGDIIYDLAPGYRQERIQVLGYVSGDWNGSLNIPGFVYDQAIVVEWTPYTDYSIGDTVKYKEYYYSANSTVAGSSKFESEYWNRLSKKPTASLNTNFDYKINQFADFYDLDSDNFDSEQQRMAQHLIGYQKRQYLENIINDDVSQYKFYQGFIQDKGTRNSVDKLFDSLASADKESVDFYEEWAVKSSQYGAATGFDEIEYQLNESKYKLEPQPVQLVSRLPETPTDLTYRIADYQVFLKPDGYDQNRLPVSFKSASSEFVKTVGYITADDINRAVTTKDGILNLSTTDVNKGALIWVSTDKQTWDVIKHVDTDLVVKSVEVRGQTIILTTNTVVQLSVGDIIGLYNLDTDDSLVEAFYKITKVYLNKIEIISDNTDWKTSTETLAGIITSFVSKRAKRLEDTTSLTVGTLSPGELIWIDSVDGTDTGKWLVIQNNPVYLQQQTINSTVAYDSTLHNFGNSLSASSNNTRLAIGIPDSGLGGVHVYQRAGDSNNLELLDILEFPVDDVSINVGNAPRFGESVAVSPDGRWLAIGAPNASDVKTTYKGEYNTNTEYAKTDIVKYSSNLWRATTVIPPAADSLQFSSFVSFTDINLAAAGNPYHLLQTGDYKLYNSTVSHVLVRAPITQYVGSKKTDSIVLKWNTHTTNNPLGSLVDVQPFDGKFIGIDSDFITGTHVIQEKVDVILFVNTFSSLPEVGDIVVSDAASGTVVYVGSSTGNCIIYLNNITGSFEQSGEIYINGTIIVGAFINDTDILTDVLGGFWLINSPSYNTTDVTDNIFTDVGYGLIIQDILLAEEVAPVVNYYNNIQDTVTEIGTQTSINDQVSFIESLSYEGDPYEVFGQYLTPKWTMRISREMYETLEIATNPTPTFILGIDSNVDLSATAFTSDILNNTHTVVTGGVWDGYIDFTFDNYGIDQLPFELLEDDLIRDSLTGATARVAFYKRQFNDVRIYVKLVNGTWSDGNDFEAPSRIERVRGIEVRNIGEIDATSIAYLSDTNNKLGPIVVLEHSQDLPIAVQTSLVDQEYWIYSEDTNMLGEGRPANIPSSVNQSWIQVYNIPATTSVNAVVSGLDYEGMISIYEKTLTGLYKYNNSFVMPERAQNARLGDELMFTQSGSLYKLAIASGGNNEISNPGSIHFIKYGTDTNGISYDWAIDINPLFKGDFVNTLFYRVNEIVRYENNLYEASRNIAAGEWDSTAWNLLTDATSHVGYIPSSAANAVQGEEFFDPENGIKDFATRFDMDSSGDVLVASSLITGNDSTSTRTVNVYRQVNGQYTLAQTILPPHDDITTGEKNRFGDSVSISADGEMIAIGEPLNDDVKVDQGKVYIYKLSNNNFVLSQEIASHGNEIAEEFGYNVSFDGNQLAITALSGDIELTTTFDTYSGKLEGLINDPTSNLSDASTTFDNQFTTFQKVILNSGVVYMYERINDTLIFAEEFKVDNYESRFFGKNLLVNNNHVYVGMPRLTDNETYQGVVIDYRKAIGSTAWVTHREPIDQVEINKIKSAFLYNTKTNSLISDIDFIDPVQGRIAAPAEQELSFKTYYDPAAYTLGDTSVIVDATSSWGAEHVGQLWWDLSAVKYYNYQQNDITYQTNYWAEVFPGTSVNVYEWVESELLPTEYDAISDTEEGLTVGASGTSLYGDTIYSEKLVWDSISQTSRTRYYFWVLNKAILPQVDFRSMTAIAVQSLILDPAGQGYKFIALMSKDRFAMFNMGSLLNNTEVALNLRYWTIDNQTQNIHNEYKIITQGLASSKPSKDIELKWFDSLIGYDTQSRLVPDPSLSVKMKYGSLNRPRQSWFINKTEAFKQVIERANSVLIKNIIVDEFDISRLLENDPIPSQYSRSYDQVIDTYEDINFVGIAKKTTASLTPIINDGRITSVIINNTGYGYKDPSYTGAIGSVRNGPAITINGVGSAADITCDIDELGKITSVTINNSGSGYDSNTTLSVRNFSVLVNSDVNVLNKWSVYNLSDGKWNRTISQRYDVNLYWNYTDWYATDYNEFTKINYLIDNSYELPSLANRVGDIVKIQNVGSGGWLLLEKVNNLVTDNYTQNYKVIGKQNATLQFNSSIYDTRASQTGFDLLTYDVGLYDSEPTTEARIILETIRDSLFVDNLEVEYNKLFVSSLRYVFTEQPNVDWAFKTSFIKAQHNVGNLTQRVTFKNDNLESYQSYINEVKPYKTKIREYVSAYQSTEVASLVTTDFDLPPRYNSATNKIVSSTARLENSTIVDLQRGDTYPDKHWLDNVAYKITAVEIADSGAGYTEIPIIEFISDSGTGATAKAYVSNGTITKINVINPGSGYLTAPTIVINGSLVDTGRSANAVAIIGESLVRSTSLEVKFDRIDKGIGNIISLDETQTFIGTGNTVAFNLNWPMNLTTSTVQVIVNGIEALRSEYTFTNVVDNTKTYERYLGRVIFTTPPKLGTSIEVNYKKPLSLLTAADRTVAAYAPTTGMTGKDLGQLMDGIDYGGVEVTGYNFEDTIGWGNFTDAWDEYDETFEDIIIDISKNSPEILSWATVNPELSNTNWQRTYPPLVDGIVYNVYYNSGELLARDVRIDDPNYNTVDQTNANAIMTSIIGDGVTQSLDLQSIGLVANLGSKIVIRKTTSDGSINSTPTLFDTALSGGDLAYASAVGIAAEDIVVDGDAFISVTNSKGPEELVPGLVLDTVDIQVYHRPGDGSSKIYTQVYETTGATEYPLGIHPNSANAVFVMIDGIKTTDYVINFTSNTLEFNIAPAINKELSIIVMGEAGQSILDINSFIGDGSTTEFITDVKWQESMTHFVNINGNAQVSELFNADESYGDNKGYTGIRFVIAPAMDSVVNYGLFYATGTNFSQVTTTSFIADGSSTAYAVANTLVGSTPVAYQTIVKVDNTVLHSGYSQRFIMTSAINYQLQLWQVAPNSIASSDVEVFINGELLVKNIDYRYDSSSSLVRILISPVEGSILDVFIPSNGEYAFGYKGFNAIGVEEFIATPGEVHFATAPAIGKTIEITTFSNYDILDIERIKYDVISRETLVPDTQEYNEYVELTNGLVKLRKPAIDSQYVWVFVNGLQLTPNVDYYVTEGNAYVKLISTINSDDVIDLIHFTAPVLVERFGFRQFKDMLNRVHYKRLDDTNKYVLRDSLLWNDLRIELADATGLAEPNIQARIPGIIFIDNERIEYYVKQGNTLRQLRRGTLGTGVKTAYPAGTRVYDQSVEQTMPYTDSSITETFYGDGSTASFIMKYDTTGIPLQNYQSSADLVEVFVAGRRLNKTSVEKYTNLSYQDSPEGDTTIPAEFTIQGNVLTINSVPNLDERILVVRKQGTSWTPNTEDYPTGESLTNANTDIARFLRARVTGLIK